jgi:signal transduction histidine kinase
LCHDLNNPLAVIVGQLDIIREKFPDLPTDAFKRLDEVSAGAERMRVLIRDAGAEARRAMDEEG